MKQMPHASRSVSALLCLIVCASVAAQAQSVDEYEHLAAQLGMTTIRTGSQPHPWEVRIWTEGLVTSESGIGLLVRFWPTPTGVTGESIAFWRRGTGAGVDSVWRAQGKTETWLEYNVKLFRCVHLREVGDYTICEQRPQYRDSWTRVHRAFVSNGGWTIPDEPPRPPGYPWILDGGGWYGEMQHDGQHRSVRYWNTKADDPPPWRDAYRIEQQVDCALRDYGKYCHRARSER